MNVEVTINNPNGAPNCSHPEAERTPLASGQGYRCETCKTVVRHQTQETCVSPTVQTVRLTKDEQALVSLRKADKRRDELKAINDAAEQFVKNWKEAETTGNDIIKLHQKFADVFEVSKPLLETVLHGFAHLRKGERIQGCATAKDWCRAALGVSYERVRQLRTAHVYLAEPIAIVTGNEEALLLTDGKKLVSPSGANPELNHDGQKHRPKLKQTLPTLPSALTADSTDNEYIKTCVRFIESTLRPLESEPQRFRRVAVAIAQEILGETESISDTNVEEEIERVNPSAGCEERLN